MEHNSETIIYNVVFQKAEQQALNEVNEIISNILTTSPNIVGSYRLGLHLPNSDLDLILGVNNESRKLVNDLFVEKGWQSMGMRISTQNSNRTILRKIFEGITVDMGLMSENEASQIEQFFIDASVWFTKSLRQDMWLQKWQAYKNKDVSKLVRLKYQLLSTILSGFLLNETDMFQDMEKRF